MPTHKPTRMRTRTYWSQALGSVVFRRIWSVLTLAGVAACQGDGLSRPGLPDERSLYWSLDLNHHAATMSLTPPYNTLTLTAVPHNVRDEALAGLPAPRYISRNPERLIVTSDGVIEATGVQSQPVAVVAMLTVNNLTHMDSVLVKVVNDPDPPMLQSFSAHPLPPDSAKLAALARPKKLSARATDADGTSITGMLVSFRSSDDLIASIHPTTGAITPRSRGDVTFVASSTMFGIRMVDSVAYEIGHPLFLAAPTINMLQTNHTIMIAAGGAVWWRHDVDDAEGIPDVIVTFADPSNVVAVNPMPSLSLLNPLAFLLCHAFMACEDSGDFVLQPYSYNTSDPAVVRRGMALRRFPVVGTYPYQSTFPGYYGQVIVVQD